MAFLRRDIWSMPPDDPYVMAYGDAVGDMQARPADDPTSWTYQAAIHGTYLNPPPPLADECKHGSWFFLSWHRMYLYWFERIVRATVLAKGGPGDWALPYWNYDTVTTNTLPLAFRNPTRPDGSPNPLYVAPPDRGAGWNAGSLALPPAITTPAFALSRPVYVGAPEFGGGVGPANRQFWGATGRLESTPHNAVHSTLGGWMGDPGTAAQDPIFWLHHCNIDRIWAVWNDEGHTDPAEDEWRTQPFSFFDESGKQVTMTGADVEDIEHLDYTYTRRFKVPHIKIGPRRLPKDFPWPPWIRMREPIPVPQPPRQPTGMAADEPGAEMLGASESSVYLRGDEERIPLRVDSRARELASRDRLEAAEPGAAPRMILTVEDIEGERNPSTVYGVYVNLPDNPSLEDLDTHHAGNVSFFGIERAARGGDQHAMGLRYAMDITDLVTSLQEHGHWRGDDIDVTFRPIRPLVVGDRPELEAELEEGRHEDAPVTIGRVSLHMA